MATRKTTTREAQATPARAHTCRECTESYDWHSTALDGHFILCRCRYYKDGRWSKLLRDRACEFFKPRPEP